RHAQEPEDEKKGEESELADAPPLGRAGLPAEKGQRNLGIVAAAQLSPRLEASNGRHPSSRRRAPRERRRGEAEAGPAAAREARRRPDRARRPPRLRVRAGPPRRLAARRAHRR